MQNWLRLLHDELIDHLDLDDEESVRPLALAVGYEGAGALEKRLIEVRGAVNEVYRTVLGGG